MHRRRKGSFLGRLFRVLLTIVVAVFLLYSAVAMIGILGMNRVSTGDRGVTVWVIALTVSALCAAAVIGRKKHETE